MAERPSPHSIAVCTLIALHSDPSSLIHTSHHDSDSEKYQSEKDENDKNKNVEQSSLGLPSSNNAINSSGSRYGIDEGADKKKSYANNIEDHLSKLIHHLVLERCDDENLINGSSYYHNAREKKCKSSSLYSLLRLLSCPQTSPSSQRRFEYKYKQASDFLLSDLTQSAQSIDSLIDLFAALRSTVANGIVDGDSAHGVYVRKRCLGFDELSFECVGRLWSALCDYVQLGSAEWNDDNDNDFYGGDDDEHCLDSCPSDEQHQQLRPTDSTALPSLSLEQQQQQVENDSAMCMLPPAPLPTGETNDDYRWPKSSKQISRKLQNQCLKLHTQIGVLPYETIESYAQSILRQEPELVICHYLCFLNCLYHKEVTGALEHLHRYFDYATIQERKDAVSNHVTHNTLNETNNNGNNGEGDGNNVTAGTDQRNVVQYAAIILASTFHKFGNEELARIATLEAIRVAQQSGDDICVAYALAWLNASSTASAATTAAATRGGDVGTELLIRASSRAAQYNLPSLVAGASLLQARHLASSSFGAVASAGAAISEGSRQGRRGIVPTRAWESLAAASTLTYFPATSATGAASTAALSSSSATVNSMTGITSSSHDAPTQIVHLDGDSSNAMEIFARQNLVGAGLWESWGYTSMSATMAGMTIELFEDVLSGEDFEFAASAIFFSALFGNGPHVDQIGVLEEEQESSRLSLPHSAHNSQSHLNDGCHILEQLCTAITQDKEKSTINLKDTRKRHLSIKSAIANNYTRRSKNNNNNAYLKSLSKFSELKKIKYKQKNNARVNPIWNIQTKILLMHEWAIRRTFFQNASSLHVLLHSSAIASTSNYFDAHIIALGQSSLLLCQKRNWERARELTMYLCHTCSQQSNVVNGNINGSSNNISGGGHDHSLRRIRPQRHAYFLLQLALINFESNPDDPTSALPPLLECLSLCESASKDPVHAVALSVLARVRLEMGEVVHSCEEYSVGILSARSMLTAALPMIMRHGHAWFQGEAFLTLAKCSLAEALDDTASNQDTAVQEVSGRRNKRRIAILKGAVSELHKSYLLFQRVEDAVRLMEISYLKAKVYDMLPGLEAKRKRNEAAGKCLRIGRSIVASNRPLWCDGLASMSDHTFLFSLS